MQNLVVFRKPKKEVSALLHGLAQAQKPERLGRWAPPDWVYQGLAFLALGKVIDKLWHSPVTELRVHVWRQMSPSRQYLTLFIPFMVLITSPIMISAWAAFVYFGVTGMIVVGGVSYSIFGVVWGYQGGMSTDKKFLRKFEERHLTNA